MGSSFALRPYPATPPKNWGNAVTAKSLLDCLAREFKTDAAHISGAIDLLDAGLSAPFIGRFRRADVGGINENLIRGLDVRRRELEELDRRRATILRALEKEGAAKPADIARIESCMDRFELEDLFLPHRRPEPEVQLAMDRGLGKLADEIVAACAVVAEAPVVEAGSNEPKSEGPKSEEPEAALQTDEVKAAVDPAADLDESSKDSGEDQAPQEAAPQEAATEEAGSEDVVEATEVPPVAAKPAAVPAPAVSVEVDSLSQPDLSPELALLCREYVHPDRGIHTDSEALAGAMRILSDRLGRSPRLRSLLRGMLRKHGVLSVKPLIEGSKAGRHKALLKLKQPLRQIQGHKLLALRSAQKDRALSTRITLDHERGMQKVLLALGKRLNPTFGGVHRVVAARALDRRLLPMLEEEIRLELKERADEEALRFLGQHLRRVLLADVHTRPSPTAGFLVDPKGNWVMAIVGANGEPMADAFTVEVGDRSLEEIAADLEPLREHKVEAIALGNGKTSRGAVQKLRNALKAGKVEAFAFLVTEAGLASYANSELARKELPKCPVHGRMAISAARRLQDPLRELLKVDPRHMGLGPQQGLVSKANVKRVFHDVIESCVAYVGCDLNRAPAQQLTYLPGIDKAAAEKIVARRVERPFERLEELREESLLDESAWTSAAAFLRIKGSSEPLDRTNLHPEQYSIARRLIEAAGSTPEDAIGKSGALRGLKRADFKVDADTWRDLQRELSYPGRDPRPALRRPELLDVETDPTRLTTGRVVEGIITSVTSFAAFVDVGLEHDAILHASQISDHYVRDAREVLAIGQVVRAKFTESKDKRLTLSMKNVSMKETTKPTRGPRAKEPQTPKGPQHRARRDGMAGAKQPRQSHGRRPGPGNDRNEGGRRGKDDDNVKVNLKEVNKPDKGAKFNPFADFFKED